MRLAVYTDYTYRRVDGRIFAERAFALFLARLADEVDTLAIAGKLDPEPGPVRYALPEGVRFLELPYFASLAQPRAAMAAMGRSLGAFWELLEEVDSVWLLGPHPLAAAFAALAAIRRKPLALGVRQDFPRYVRARHPRRRWIHLSADLLEVGWRTLARVVPVVVVGPALAGTYRGGRTLEIAVSLVGEAELERGGAAAARDYGSTQLRVLTVGRLEEEKNPLLLADIIAGLRTHDPRWRMQVCGEGSLEPALRERLHDLEVTDSVDLLGYVPHDELAAIYAASHLLLHVSWTEGFPQVLLEAFAARLPVVATDVGGIAQAAPEAIVLIPPGDAGAAVSALQRVSADAALRGRMTAEGTRYVSSRTMDAEARRVAAFLRQRRP